MAELACTDISTSGIVPDMMRAELTTTPDYVPAR
jgi:hypothetical protein